MLLAVERRKDAERPFADAEERQQKRRPTYPTLYSLQGYLYCDLLLAKGAWAALRDRASQSPTCRRGREANSTRPTTPPSPEGGGSDRRQAIRGGVTAVQQNQRFDCCAAVTPSRRAKARRPPPSGGGEARRRFLLTPHSRERAGNGHGSAPISATWRPMSIAFESPSVLFSADAP